MRQKPKILNKTVIAKSKLFQIESLHLVFRNGQERQFERIRGQHHHEGVLILPILNAETILLVKEYVAGFERYELGFPKGLIEANETWTDAANREMQEELGYAAKHFDLLKTLTTAPSYFSSSVKIVVAHSLFPSVLKGDEPEPLDVIEWPLRDLKGLIKSEDFTEARSVAAVKLLEDYLQGETS